MNCFNHPEREAVATCPKCGKGLCRECAEKYMPCMCDPCAAQTKRDQQQQAKNKEEQRKQKYRDALVDSRSEFITTTVIGIFVGIFLVWFTTKSAYARGDSSFTECVEIFLQGSVFRLVGKSLHTCNHSFPSPLLGHFGFGLYTEQLSCFYQ